MILDYNPTTKSYLLRVPRLEVGAGARVQALLNAYGFDLSTTASTREEAVLFTKEPYAAATFAGNATNRAQAMLAPITREVAASWRLHSDAHVACPAHQELWGVQKAAVEYAMPRKHVLVGDEPGVGKTPVAVCIANEMRARHALAIVPANIRLQWKKRVAEWTTMVNPYIHAIMDGRYHNDPTARSYQPGWTIVSYELTRSPAIGALLSKSKFDLIVIDEAHYLKTVDSQRTRAVFGGGDNREFDPIAKDVGKIVAMTGTPLPNRPREAYTLARALCWDSIDWASEDTFRSRFNPSMKGVRIDKATGRERIFVDERSGRESELQNRMRANFMVRRLKKDALPQLKLPVYDLVQLETTGAIRAALRAESLLHIDPEALTGADMSIIGEIATVRRMMGEAMAPQVAGYMDMLIAGGETKLVLFAWHISVMNYLEKHLGRHGIVRIDGSTGAKQKERLIEQFRTDPNIQICLGNLLSMGVGTDGLQDVANHVLVAEPSWVAGENEQPVARLHRAGQQFAVQADFFVVPGSFSERLLATALRKLAVTNKALDAGAPLW